MAALHDSARHYRAHTQLFARGHWVSLFAFVTKDSATRHYLQTWKLRQAIDDAFSDAIGKILRIRIVILIDEGQDGDRSDGYFSVASIQIKAETDGADNQHEQSNGRCE